MAQEAPTNAPKLDLRGFGDARLRFESVDTSLAGAEEQALTLRVRSGAELELAPHTSILAEVEAVVDLYRDEPQGGPPGVLIPDREVLEINRAQISHDFGPVQATGGRQQLSFDDERFVGAVEFRQNQQTYDALHVSVAPFSGVDVDMVYLWQVNRFLSSRNATSRYRGDNYLVNVGADTPAGRLTAYHYALDLDDGAGAALSQVNSSVTTGVSLAGRRYWKEVGLGWRAEYARQRDYAGNPLDYSADYWRAVATLDVAGVSIIGGHEVLGEGGVRAFQTPLGTNHAFQGAADLFVVTPDIGLRDTYLNTIWPIGEMGPFRGLTAGLRRHWFTDDIAGNDLGTEWDASLRASIYGVQTSLEFAAYAADAFGVDTQKLWVSIRRSF
ncbi:MAG TPA: alginate export family protein [Hyphomonadaceae bacterium]|jgi:hypothetical protein|nr:alginate export family protein [Hyphomonadaceae bacterium]